MVFRDPSRYFLTWCCALDFTVLDTMIIGHGYSFSLLCASICNTACTTHSTQCVLLDVTIFPIISKPLMKSIFPSSVCMIYFHFAMIITMWMFFYMILVYVMIFSLLSKPMMKSILPFGIWMIHFHFCSDVIMIINMLVILDMMIFFLFPKPLMKPICPCCLSLISRCDTIHTGTDAAVASNTVTIWILVLLVIIPRKGWIVRLCLSLRLPLFWVVVSPFSMYNIMANPSLVVMLLRMVIFRIPITERQTGTLSSPSRPKPSTSSSSSSSSNSSSNSSTCTSEAVVTIIIIVIVAWFPFFQ
mmetsp:Transcript_11064/g.16617  ORF Transcript_11064/g.16617 Transcript_11064/m.16617 type:complete len:301 (-) Transcript_11064:973-1875(-)